MFYLLCNPIITIGSINLRVLIKSAERSGSGVELQTLDYQNPGSKPGCGGKTLGKFFHSTLLQFTQLNKMSNWL